MIKKYILKKEFFLKKITKCRFLNKNAGFFTAFDLDLDVKNANLTRLDIFSSIFSYKFVPKALEKIGKHPLKP